MEQNEIIKRVMSYCGYASEAALARGLKMSPQKFLAQKKAGTINNSLLLHAVEKGANLEWARTGEGKPKSEEAATIAEDYWKEKCVKYLEELNEARKEIQRLTAPPSGASEDAG